MLARLTLARTTIVLAGAAAFCAIWAVSAAADTIHVHPGESIQAAVNGAHPGDVIVVHAGVYHQSVNVKKDDLTLRGAGRTPDGSVLKPGHGVKQCGHGRSGMCIDKQEGDHIKGFRMAGFKDFGAVAFESHRTVFRNNTFVHNDEYGVAAFASRHTEFVHNRAGDADEAGFYVGDSPHAHAVLRRNVSRGNGEFGLFLRDSSDGLAVHNRVSHNCLGIGLVNTGAPGGVHRWDIRRNRSSRNNRFCAGAEGGPPISGTGIGLIGASGNHVAHNRVLRNRPKNPAAFAPGGIVLVDSAPLGGGPEKNNTIARNTAFRNKPADIVWDGHGTGNKFSKNHCGKSNPNGLCP